MKKVPAESETEKLLPNSPGQQQTTNGIVRRAVLSKKKLLALCLLIFILIYLLYSIELPPLVMNSMDTYLTLIERFSSENVKNIKKLNKMGEKRKNGGGTLIVSNGTSATTNGISTKTWIIPSKLSKKKPIILGWNRFFSKAVYEFRYLNWGFNNCSYECVYTEDRKFEKVASAVMFHGGQSLGEELPKRRRPKQLYTMMSHECPHLSFPHLAHLADNYFNVSITYHKNSTIYIPYEQFNAITSQTPQEEIWSEDEIRKQMSLKKRLALQIVSNCNAPSGRDELTKQLQQLMPLDVFGRCNERQCDKEKCYQQQMDSHFFYIAFENSVCPYYVTEKFWNALRSLTVPVVLNRAVLKEAGIPDDVYISADDFDSAQQLADYLKKVRKDANSYLDYFKWTKRYRKQWDHNTKPTALCQLCEIVHKQRRKDKFRTYTVSLDKLWSEKTCRRNFVQNELFKKN